MIRKNDIGRSAIKGDKHLIDASLPADKLIANAIKIVEEFSLVAGVQEVDASVTGTPTFPHSVNILRDETIENVKDGEAILDFEFGAAGGGTLQIYDETNNVVLGETGSLNKNSNTDALIFSIAVADLKAGARIVCRANVTTKGGTSEVLKIHRCFIRVIRGYS